jgi:hypothetical protein
MLTSPPARTVSVTPQAAANAALATYTTSAGYATGWFSDPIGLWVNSEQVDVAWSWASLFYCALPYSLSVSVPAYVNDGWTQTMNSLYPSWICTYPSYAASLSWGGSEFAIWQNPYWPPCYAQNAAAVAWYYPLSAEGDNTGQLLGNFTWYLSGPGFGCINLLTPGFNLVRTYN